MEQVYVGIDVAKDRLDVHLRPSGEAFAVARDGKGLEELSVRLGGLEVALVVLEATGGFEVTVAAALCATGLPLAVVNPRQVRDFARATGRLAKTDALDAAAIAHFAEAVRPEPRPVPDEQARALGLALRLAERLSCGEPAVLDGSRLAAEDGRLVLRLAPEHRPLASGKARTAAGALARALGRAITFEVNR